MIIIYLCWYFTTKKKLQKEIDCIVFEWIVMYFVYFSKMSSFKFTFCVISALLTIVAVVNSQSRLKLTIISKFIFNCQIRLQLTMLYNLPVTVKINVNWSFTMRGRCGRHRMVVGFTTTTMYLCNQYLSPLKLWVGTPFIARCTRYNIMW